MLPGYQLIDLTHTLDEKTPTWEGECGFHRKIVLDYDVCARVYEYQCLGGAGTHIDAPSHFFPNGVHIDEICVEDLVAPLCIIDLLGELRPNSQIDIREIETYEKNYGEITAGSFVVAHTGWWRNWGFSGKYRNLNEKGEIIVPTITAEAGKLLLKRQVLGIGIDTLSPDPYWGDYPIHNLFLGAGKYIIENLTNLDHVPKKGAYLLSLPLKIREGTESPIRSIALVPDILSQKPR